MTSPDQTDPGPVPLPPVAAVGAAGRGWVVGRRELFGLVGATFLLAACGSRSSPIKVVDSSASGRAAATTGAGASPVVQLGGSHVAAGQALSISDAQRIAAQANGHWQGGWHDSAGRSGNTDVVISIDSTARTARTRVAFTGDLLGAPLAAQTYEIDLLSFMLTADSYTVTSPQFGQVTIVPGGATSATATAQSIPGHPEIATITINGSRAGRRVDVSYTISYTAGNTVKGTMAWTSTNQPATPAPLPSPGAAPNPADVQTGAYAASLLTGGELSAIFASPFPAPQANGGRLDYDTGIDVSNAEVTADGYNVAYSVYIGNSAANTAAFWAKQGLGLANIPGTWKAAFWLTTIPSLYVYATDTRALLIKVQPDNSTSVASPAQLTTWQQLAENIATKIVATLSGK